jgi:hypothetical protein
MNALLSPAAAVPLLLLLSCCTSSPALITDPRTGETASCEITALSQALAEEVARRCQQNYEAAGWVAVRGPIAHSVRSVGL